MVARADVRYMNRYATVAQIEDRMMESNHTRMPLVGDDLDDVVLPLLSGSILDGRVFRPDGKPAIGLAISAELPLIIVDSQRAGPSTGLPTKTEQSDLYLAVYGRNADAPMPVIAAATPTDCFDVAIESIRLATLKAARQGKLLLISPVTIFASGRCVATTMCTWAIGTSRTGILWSALSTPKLARLANTTATPTTTRVRVLRFITTSRETARGPGLNCRRPQPPNA